VNVFLREKLASRGFETKIMPATHNFNEKELLSDWSHKHVAYIAGLGGFGLHRMLITEMGCCGRLGSVITSAKIEPTQRSNNKYCLYFHNKSYKKCIEKCIFDALSIQTFDRHKCYNKCLENAKIYAHLGLVDVCGKCVSVVPCSFRNPVPS
jgi:epoxyqueuosine reductase QueG